MRFNGYRQPDGRIGIRNQVIILPSVACSVEVGNAIARKVKGIIAISRPHGSAELPFDAEQTLRTLAGVGKNPNVAAVLVVGLGCEVVDAPLVASKNGQSRKPVKSLVIQDVGGCPKTVREGVKIIKEMLAYASSLKRNGLASIL